MTVLITGGVRSGKSRYVLERAVQAAGQGLKCFIATAEAVDEETKSRIRNHQQERGADWTALEAPLKLGEALTRVPSSCSLAVIDCLTFWINNLLYYYEADEIRLEHEIQQFQEQLQAFSRPLLIVTNEVGLGIMPGQALSRRYQDLLGKVNQQTAAQAEEVVFMVSGIPMILKGVPNERLAD